MSVCSICRFHIVDDSIAVCPNCGAAVQKPPQDDGIEEIAAGQLTGQSDPSSYPVPTPAGDDSIEICDPGEFLCAENSDDESPPDIAPVGDPIPPPEPDESPDGSDVPDDESEATTNGKIAPLSDEQVENIRSGLLHPEDEDYVHPTDASAIMNGLNHDSPAPDSPPEPDAASTGKQTPGAEKALPALATAFSEQSGMTGPEKESAAVSPGAQSPPMRRVAYFHKNFIQLTGPFSPTSGEELSIGERLYLLKPKKIKNQYMIGTFAVLLVIVLFFVGKQFISPTLPDQGVIIGVILDPNDRPFINGVEVSMPEAGKKVISDPLGFFRFEKIPTGVYAISFTLEDGTVISENLSVAGGDITTITLGGEEADWDGSETVAASVATAPPSQGSRPPQTASTAPQKKDPPPAATSKSGGEKKKQYAALRLKANVDNARLRVSGEILGRGNTTYKKLAPGKHKAEVTRDGYKRWTGTIRLSEGETYTLAVTLEPATQTDEAAEPESEPTYNAEDFYKSGGAMLADANASAAIADFTEAIRLKPSMADAYSSRADAYLIADNASAAEADYVRAGEIFMTQKRTQTALDMFNKALDIDKKSIPALINLADYNYRQGDRSEALRLYKNVLRYDGDNFRANFESGKIYFAMGKNRDAEKRLREAVRINPQVPEAYHYLMLNSFARDDFNSVKSTYTDFKSNVGDDEVQAFKNDMRYDAILRIVGEYERP